MILLDTDTLTLLLYGHKKVAKRMQQVEEEVAITAITRGEVLRGRIDSLLKAPDGQRAVLAQQRLAVTEQLLARYPWIPFDAAAAGWLDRLLNDQSLRRIGRADLLIAAIVLSRQAKLITRNVRHFRLIRELHLENWAD